MTRRQAVKGIAAAAAGLGNASRAAPIAAEQATTFAKLALKGIAREYPNKLDHVMSHADDVKSPQALHPAFYGCYDWHSAVHGHWMLVRLLKAVPVFAEAKAARTALAGHLTEANLKAETDYFLQPAHKSFERTYGWAWLLKLAEELHTWDDPDGKAWAAHLRPLAQAMAARYVEFLPKQTYPIRTGVHPNTAFGLAFAHDYAVAVGNRPLRERVVERAKTYFGEDRDYPAAWEPSGADFFSAALMEADLMRRVLPATHFRDWFAKFLPGAAKGEPRSLFAPATVTDRTDPQLVHLDGLNLSRAWCLRGLLAALPAKDAAREALTASAARHADAGLRHVTSGDYAGEHWLASFAVYLLLATPTPE